MEGHKPLNDNATNTLSISEIRGVLDRHTAISKHQYATGDSYRVDRSNASHYFETAPEWSRKIRKYFAELHEAGEKVVYVDICGRANGDSLGADMSYSFSMRPSEQYHNAIAKPNFTLIEGDLFNTEDFSSFIETIRGGDAKPALITFEPIVGLENYDPLYSKDVPHYKDITYAQLEKRFTALTEILKPGGYLYLGIPFQMLGTNEFIKGIPQEEQQYALKIKELATEQNCEVEIRTSSSGPYFLLRKKPV